jgi:hypothetical protein
MDYVKSPSSFSIVALSNNCAGIFKLRAPMVSPSFIKDCM